MSIHIVYHSGRISEGSIKKLFGAAFNINDCVFWGTTKDKLGFACATEAIEDGAKIIVAVGGDGTLNEVGQAIMQAQAANPSRRIKLGMVPSGSGNDLVRTLQITQDYHQLAALIQSNQTFNMDVGVLEHHGEESYFFNAMDAGMGADALRSMQNIPQWVGTSWAYSIGILKSMLTYRNRQMRITIDDQILEGKFRMVIVSNGNFIGNGHCVAPDGCLDDGLLEVLCVGDVTVFDYLKQLPKLKRQAYMDHPMVSYHKATHIEISGDALTELDGEFGPSLPVKIKVLQRVLEVFSPLTQATPAQQR